MKRNIFSFCLQQQIDAKVSTRAWRKKNLNKSTAFGNSVLSYAFAIFGAIFLVTSSLSIKIYNKLWNIFTFSILFAPTPSVLSSSFLQLCHFLFSSIRANTAHFFSEQFSIDFFPISFCCQKLKWFEKITQKWHENRPHHVLTTNSDDWRKRERGLNTSVTISKMRDEKANRKWECVWFENQFHDRISIKLFAFNLLE